MAITDSGREQSSVGLGGVATKPVFSWDQAARQITRDLGADYLPSYPTALSLTYAYRATDAAPPPPPGVSGSWIGTGLDASAGGFQRFNATQIAGFDVWVKLIQDVANITVARVGSGTTGDGAFSDNAQVLLGNFTTGATTTFSAGFATYIYDLQNGAYSRAGYVNINGTQSDNTSPSLDNYGVSTLLHEFMHVLGLSHPGNYNAAPGVSAAYSTSASYAQDSSQYTLMSYFTETETGANYGGLYGATPLLHDIAALQRLYGANLTTRTGDTVYGFNSNTGSPSFTLTNNDSKRVFTIWDAGGNDTLDLSGYTTASQIDLREEAFSSAGTRSDGGAMISNISIAKGAVVENAIGGAGNDVIVGNAANNNLTGGGGDDTITGGGGTDTALYRGARSQYTITQSAGKTIITDLTAGRDGTDTLSGIAWAQFTDAKVAAVAYDPIGIAIADQLSVVYFGRGVSQDWRNSTSTVVSTGASADIQKAFFNAAITDRVFAATDSVQTITNKTFKNIFGVDASTFEQDAWANTVSAGFVSKESLPWAMFNSYLGATNVPDSYKIPAQSRIIAVNAFTNAVSGTAEAALGSAGASGAEAARAWLLPIRTQSDAAAKVATASSTVASLSGSTTGGPLDPANDPLHLVGVSPMQMEQFL